VISDVSTIADGMRMADLLEVEGSIRDGSGQNTVALQGNCGHAVDMKGFRSYCLTCGRRSERIGTGTRP
jgi:hypothetical protein